jgi:general secretion pathway protein D
MAVFLRLAILCLTLLAPGCGGNMQDVLSSSGSAPGSAQADASDDQYMQRLVDLRKSAHASPTDADVKVKLRHTEEEGGAKFLAAGNKLLNSNQFNEAIQQFELGLVADPASPALQEARMTALRRKEVARLFNEEQRAKTVGNLDLAQSLLEKADSLERGNPTLLTEIKDVERRRGGEEARYLVRAFEAPAPMAVNFRQAKLKEALRGISEPYGLNFVFDQGIEDSDVNVSAKNVTFQQTFSMILQSSNASYKVIGPNSVLIYQNTPEKRAKYADMYFKTFHLSNVKAERMAELLKGSMDLKTLVANNELNTIQVRDSRETLDVIERLVSANDRAPAEIMLDVEILEINRSKAEQLGVDYGSQITLSPASVASTAAHASGAGIAAKTFVNGQLLRAVLGESGVSLPSLTLKYLQHDVDARTLAKPRVRTMDGRPAKIHVGDRVPLRSSTVQDVTGQTRTMYEYRDIGIKLDVLPKYHLDDTISVELNMEVSSLGANLGTVDEPAFAIGTRNVTTTMLLREGETALLGGLIRDDERHSVNKVPGLSQMGAVGRLFMSNDDQDSRTDVLLTITPKILRDQALPRHRDSNFYSGGQGHYTTEASYDYLKKNPSESEPPQYNLSPKNGGGMVTAAAKGGARMAKVEKTGSAVGNRGWLGFGAPSYAVARGQTVTIDVNGANIIPGSTIQARVLYNPDRLDLVSGAGANGETVTVKQDQDGVAIVEIKGLAQKDAASKSPLAKLHLKAKSAGMSYLMLNMASNGDGVRQELQLGASKIEVR